MQSKLVIGSFFLSAFANAQFDNINGDGAVRAVTDVANFAVSLATNTAFQSDIVAIATAIPDSVVAQASTDPVAFENSLETGTTNPAWVTAIPTTVFNSLETILAKPNKANDDVDSIVFTPQASSVFANSALPTSIQNAFFSDPLGLVLDLATASTNPSWVSKVPATLQTQIGSVINQAFSTVAADYESTIRSYPVSRTSTGTAAPTSTKGIFQASSCSPVTVIVTVTAGSSTGSLSSKPTFASTGFPKPSVGLVPTSAGFPKAVGTAPTASVPRGTASSNVAVFTGTKSTGAPIAFTGAAAPMKTAAVGVAALFAGAGALMNA